MYSIHRGDIYYIYKSEHQTGSEQQAGRPAVIISNDKNNKHCDTVELVYCTTKTKTVLPTHVEISSTPQKSTVLCEQVTTVSVDRLGSYIGMCSDEEMAMIDEAIMVSLNLSKQKSYFDSESSIDASSVEKSAPYISAVAERDTYKSLYENIINRLIKKRNR